MKNENINKFGIVVFESLPDNESKTGYELYSTTIKYKTFQEENLSSEYYDILDRNHLIETLNKIVDDSILNNYFYLFHFEIHGFDGGFELKNGDLINWDEILPILQKLNIYYRNQLTIYLAVCKGASLLKYINPMGRSPFGYIIASTKNIKLNDLKIGFESFYNHFFFSFDIFESLEIYNSVIENTESRLSLISSKYCIETLCDFERDTFDKNEIIAIIKDAFKTNNTNFNNLPENIKKEIFDLEIIKLRQELIDNKDFFLMKDLT